MTHKFTCAAFLFLFLTFSLVFFAQDSVLLKGEKPDFYQWQTLGKGISLLETFAPLKSYVGDSKLTILRLNYQWQTLGKGISLLETFAPLKSYVGDSKLTILRLNPDQLEFHVYAATHGDSVRKDAMEWADSLRLNIVFNAGMYELSKPLNARGFLKTFDHYNNPNLAEGFNCMLGVGPKDTSKYNNIDILDLQCANWQSAKNDFEGYVQCLRMIDCNGGPMSWRMIDCNGGPMSWTRRKQSCSMLVAAKDPQGRFYLIFCRSPYSQNQMIAFMKEMPFELSHALYLEGGPETSLLVDVNEHCIQKVGSWISTSYETDKNNHFWNLPNIVGIRMRP